MGLPWGQVRRRAGARARSASVALLALAAACGGEPRPVLRTGRVHLAILQRPALHRVVAEHAEDPVRVDQLQPNGRSASALPALCMTPPAEVRCALDGLPPDAVLDLSVGIADGHYRGGGRVRFEVEWDGRPALREELKCGPGVPAERRRWFPHRVRLSGAGELVLRTSWIGPGDPRVRVGFGGLDVLEPFEVPRARATPDAPNVVMVVVDTLRADALSAYGHARRTSPALDALAARGTLFERAFVPSPWTSPSTASLLTTLSPPEHGVGFGGSGLALDHELVLLGEVFLAAGVATAGFSSNPLVSRARAYDQGFVHWSDYRWKKADVVVPDALAWLDANREHRFFLYLHLVDTHSPYRPPPELTPWVGEPPSSWVELQPTRRARAICAGEPFDPDELAAEVAYERDLYDGEVAFADRWIGTLLDALAERGLTDRTVVAVTSDHGEEFLEHGLTGHVNNLHDELVRVPLIVAGPGVPAVRETERVEARHLASALVDLAGLRRPRGWAAGDLFRPPGDGAPLFFTTGNRWLWDPAEATWVPFQKLHGVRVGPWMQFLSPPQADRPREYAFLYDRRTDPDGRTDLAATDPARVEAHNLLIREWVRDGVKGERASEATEADLDLLDQLGYAGE